jgi:hypothetical protein
LIGWKKSYILSPLLYKERARVRFGMRQKEKFPI